MLTRDTPDAGIEIQLQSSPVISNISWSDVAKAKNVKVVKNAVQNCCILISYN